jgi:hypothetical protein
MSYVNGQITLGATGTKNVTIGFQPTWVRFVVSAKGTGDTAAHMSVGVGSTSNQSCDSFFADTTGAKSVQSTSKVVSHYERVSGSITEKLAASFTGTSATGFSLNVTAADTGYTVDIEAGS